MSVRILKFPSRRWSQIVISFLAQTPPCRISFLHRSAGAVAPTSRTRAAVYLSRRADLKKPIWLLDLTILAGYLRKELKLLESSTELKDPRFL